MFTREAVIAEARSWLGTPWHHQASLKGVGCDCIGFIRGVAQPFVGEIEIPLDYPETWHLYRAEPRMYLGFKARAEEIDAADARPGDILLFGAGKGPAHHCAYVDAPFGDRELRLDCADFDAAPSSDAVRAWEVFTGRTAS